MKIETTEDYWDCECLFNYIHKKEIKECPVCKCHQDDCPDSIVEEVIKHNIMKGDQNDK